MALGFEKLTEKMKHSSKEEHSDDRESGSHGHHEGKAEAPVSPVLIDRPGASDTSKLDGKGLQVTIVASHWYGKVVHSLVDACSKELLAKGVEEDSLHLVEVAGAFELPFAAARLIDCKDKSRRPDAVICIGCMVQDSTHMCEIMSQAVAHGIMQLNVTSDTPVIFGVLSCASESQAQSCTKMQSCCGIDESHKCNHGVSWAQSALQMAHLKRCSSAREMERCCCTRCVGRGSGKSGERKSEKHESSKHESCASCKSSPGDCSCKDCKCFPCCAKREACRGCGCPPDKCSCHECDCSGGSAKKTGAVKALSSEHGTKQEAMKNLSTERAGHEESSSKSDRSSVRCVRCGSQVDDCKCGTTTTVKHNLQAQQVESVAERHDTGDQHSGGDEVRETGSNADEHASKKHQSHNSCKTCGSLADKCSCKECECQVCSSKIHGGEHIEPAIKSATSSAIVCGGDCIRASQRAATGGCPGCECPAGGCPCTKCSCPLCGPHQKAFDSTPCRGSNEARKRAIAGNCPACGCPAGHCPCTGCICPICKSL
ncbi:unnamed protein product [Peronospora effusa]|nr:unnamed protein product [Peronospora effusa]